MTSTDNVVKIPGRARNMLDTLMNLVSGLGTSKDKASHMQFVFTALSQKEIEDAYRGDWIARKVVDIPAQDATREWREWQAEKEDITKLEGTERDFDIQGKVQWAMTLGRLYGGAALILGVEGAGNEDQPLDVEKVGKDSLKFIHVVNRWELGASEIEMDLTSQNYRLPKFYQVNSQLAQIVKIHYSRVIRFMGNQIPNQSMVVEGWGDSVLQAVDDAVRAAGGVTGGIASLVQEAKVDIIKIPQLSELLTTQEYADRLIQRFSYANQVKSITNAYLLDTEEEHTRIVASFASLPEVLQMYLSIASAASDIPATRLLGQSPGGLNATGDSDTRNHYDRISSEQNSKLRPQLSPLDEILIRHTFGTRDEAIEYRWRPLWQMTPSEKADIAVKKATVFTSDVNAGLLDHNALKLARENQLIEDGTYPGLEQILDAQDAGDIPTQAEEFAHDPTLNPDHPENKAATETALAGAKSATKQANAPIPPQKPKAPLRLVKDAFGQLVLVRHTIGDAFNPNQPRNEQGEWTSGGGAVNAASAASGGVVNVAANAIGRVAQGAAGAVSYALGATSKVFSAASDISNFFSEKLKDPEIRNTVGKVALFGIGAALATYGVMSAIGAYNLYQSSTLIGRYDERLFGPWTEIDEEIRRNIPTRAQVEAVKQWASERQTKIDALKKFFKSVSDIGKKDGVSFDAVDNEFTLTSDAIDLIESITMTRKNRKLLEALRFDVGGNIVGKHPIADFNPNHDPHSGEFTSGSGSEESGWETAKSVGIAALKGALLGVAAWAVYKGLSASSAEEFGPPSADFYNHKTDLFREAIEKFRRNPDLIPQWAMPPSSEAPGLGGKPDTEFPNLGRPDDYFKRRKLDSDESQFQLAKADVNFLANYLKLTPELKLELAALTFNKDNYIVNWPSRGE